MKLLLVTGRYPSPARRGDQLRVHQFVELLSSRASITLLTPEAPSGAPPPPRADRVVTYRSGGPLSRGWGVARAWASGRPLQSGLFRHRDLGRQLARLAPEHDLVLLQLARLSAELERLGGHRCFVDLIDSLALSTRLRARFDPSWWSPALRFEARRLAAAESAAVRLAQGVLVVSERDRQAIVERLPAELAGSVRVVPLWVEPLPEERMPPPAPIVAFTGNLGYFVNADALRWFLRFVWEGIRARCPDVRLIVAGDRPDRSLRGLLGRAGHQGVELIRSPQDLSAVLRSATIAVAPLRAGAGTPVKVLEAWAAGVPVLASPWAAAGTTGQPGRDFVVAERPEEWIEKGAQLLSSAEERQRLVVNARRRLLADYSRDAVQRALDDALGLAPSSTSSG